jgi:16S rRNA (guanine527-N7)-methyltransferase
VRIVVLRKERLEMLKSTLEFYGIDEPDAKASKINDYARMVQSKRDWAGLVSRGMPSSMDAAVAESVSLAAMIGPDRGKRVADVGAGGGLLGLVIAIVEPGLEVTLIEAASRKAAFLAEAVGALGLSNAKVENARAESLDAAPFDVVVSRAAGKLKELVPLALSLLRAGGRYIALKASDFQDELDMAAGAINESGGKLAGASLIEYPPALQARRRASLVVIEKL